MSYMSDEERSKCHAIIHAASAAAGGVGLGLAQLPGSDNAIITPIQITMVVGLGRVFDQEITEAFAKSLVASQLAALAGRTLSQVLIGWIPVIGNAINATTAAGITEAVGWAIDNDFAKQA